MTSNPPARLFVLLARTSPVGVILRRGPSDWVQMIKWQTDTDTLEAGQWIKARLYEGSCNLSSDGKLLIYYVFQGSNWTRNPEVGMRYTAISKPPYFTALVVWPRIRSAAFIDDRTVRVWADSVQDPMFQLPHLKVVSKDYEPSIDPETQKTIDRHNWIYISNEYKAQLNGDVELFEPLDGITFPDWDNPNEYP
ncbi:MAG: hypothetical protein R3E39_25820 [Anaerolineae bacterium]